MNKLLYIFISTFLTISMSVNGQLFSQQSTPINSSADDFDYLLMEAVKLKAGGNIDRAVQLFERCIQLEPEAPTPYVELSEILLSQGRVDEALYCSKKAVEYGGENQMYLLSLARTYQAAQYPDSSLLIYQKLSLLHPNNLDIKLGQVSLYFDMQQYEEALPLLDTIQLSSGYITEIVLAKCQAYVSLDRKEDAISFLKEAITSDSSNPVFLGTLAEISHTAGKDDDAVVYYNQMLELFPDFVSGQLSFIDFYVDKADYESAFKQANNVIDNQAFAFDPKMDLLIGFSADSVIFNKYKDQYMGLIDKVSEQYPDRPQVKMLKVDFDLRNQNFETAKNELLALTSEVKNNYMLWAQLGYVLNQTKDYDLQIKSMTEAISYFKEQVNLYVFKSYAESQTADYKSAVQTLKTALNYLGNAKEDQAEIYSLLGDVYDLMHEYASSDDFYLLSLDLDPENVYTLNNYAYHLALRGENLTEAKKYILSCLEIVGANSTYLDTAAWVFYKMGDNAKALEYMNKTLAAGEESGLSSEIYLHYIEILVADDKIKEAKSFLKKMKKDSLFYASDDYQKAKELIKYGVQ